VDVQAVAGSVGRSGAYLATAVTGSQSVTSEDLTVVQSALGDRLGRSLPLSD
jgi:hypothetical protein